MKVESGRRKVHERFEREKRGNLSKSIVYGRRRIEKDRMTHPAFHDRKEIAFKVQLAKRSSDFGLDSRRRVQG